MYNGNNYSNGEKRIHSLTIAVDVHYEMFIYFSYGCYAKKSSMNLFVNFFFFNQSLLGEMHVQGIQLKFFNGLASLGIQVCFIHP